MISQGILYSFLFQEEKHIHKSHREGRCRACGSSTNRSLKLKKPWSTTRGRRDGAILHPPRVRIGGIGVDSTSTNFKVNLVMVILKGEFLQLYPGKSLLNHHWGKIFKIFTHHLQQIKDHYIGDKPPPQNGLDVDWKSPLPHRITG